MSRRGLLQSQRQQLSAPSARSLGFIMEEQVVEEPVPPAIEQFRKAEIDTVNKVLDRIDQVSAKRVKEGFSKRNFQLGVLNSLMLAFVFGKLPQHFWLVFVVEISFLVPMKMIESYKAKPLSEVLYYLDYCWVMNIFGIAVVTCLFLDVLTDQTFISLEWHQTLYATIFGISCGPLLGATMVLPFVALVFHDFVIMTGLFIHILPPMVMYTLKWNYPEIHESWPQMFQLSFVEGDMPFFPQDHLFFLPFTGIGTIAGNTIAFYFMWFIPYTIWMVLFGMNLPRKNRKDKNGNPIPPKYDTVFHSTVRNGLTVFAGKILWGRPASVSKEQMESDDYEMRDFIVYMAMHAVLACSSVYILAYPCYKNQTIHTCMIMLLVAICVARGAARYVYYVTAMYDRAIRKDFAELLDASAETDKNK